MVQAIQAKDLTLHDVKLGFGLTQSQDEQFFREWLDGLPKLTNLEQQSLDQVKADYLYLGEYPMPEDMVKMVVLSPLLAMAGFYRPPFRITVEKPVKIAAEDQGKIVRGRIDILVLQEQFWVLVIESKKGEFSLKQAIPQALAYMVANPDSEKPTFGLITNGSHFLFMKLMKHQFALSNEFTLFNRGNDLYIVLRVLKQLAQLLS